MWGGDRTRDCTETHAGGTALCHTPPHHACDMPGHSCHRTLALTVPETSLWLSSFTVTPMGHPGTSAPRGVLFCQKYVPCVPALISSDATIKVPPVMASGHSGLLPGVLHGHGHSASSAICPRTQQAFPLGCYSRVGMVLSLPPRLNEGWAFGAGQGIAAQGDHSAPRGPSSV